MSLMLCLQSPSQQAVPGRENAVSPQRALSHQGLREAKPVNSVIQGTRPLIRIPNPQPLTLNQAPRACANSPRGSDRWTDELTKRKRGRKKGHHVGL